MRKRRRYQSGGVVEDDEFIFEGSSGPLGQLSPADAFLGILAGQYMSTPEAQEEYKRILQNRRDDDWAPEKELIGQIRTAGEGVAAALEAARDRILSRRYNPGQALLAAGAALGQPTRTGAFGESVGNMAGALSQYVGEKGEFDREQDSQLAEIESKLAQTGLPAAQAELQLEQLRRQLENKLEVEALKGLGRPVAGQRAPDIIPRSIQALDRAYAPEHLEFLRGGAQQGQQAIDTLKFAREILRSGSDALSGPYAGAIANLPGVGRWLQAFTSPQGAEVRDLVEQTIQQDLRAILGAQFTEREGERLLARTYNPNLEEWRNARRLDWLIERLERALANKRAMADYYQRNLTLAGFEGPTAWKVDDFIPPISIGQEDLMGTGGAADFTDELSPATRRSLEPGIMLGLDSAEIAEIEAAQRATRGRARGGRVRHFQEGGLADIGEEDDSGLADLQMLWQALGLAPDVLLGAGMGLTGEAALSGIERRVRGGPERQVIAAIEEEGMDPVEVAKGIKKSRRMGVPETLMDVDAAGIKAMAEDALEFGGPASRQAVSKLRQRHAGARDRVEERVNKGLKPFPFFEEQMKLKDALYHDSDPLYKRAYAKAQSLPMDDKIRAILDTPDGRRAVRQAVTLFQNVPGKKIGPTDALGMVRNPSLEFFDYVKRGFDQLISKEEAQKPTPRGRSMRQLRNQLRDWLDEVAPDEYRAARQQYAGDLEVLEALEEGRQFRKLQPQQLARKAQLMSFAEKNAFRTGMAQKLFEDIQGPSTARNTAAKIVGSPAELERLRPFFDSSREFKLFVEALRKEAELFETERSMIRRGDQLRVRRAKTKRTPIEYAAQTAPGFRLAISPLGWALRIIRDRPKMSEKSAAQALEILQRGDPKEMDDFIRRTESLRRLRGSRMGRRAGAALIGGGIGAALGLGRDSGEPEE